MQLTKYLKTAFLNRWNLLAFLGAAGFALLSRQADVALPLVLAVEAAYLGLVGTHPKFQRYVDAQSAKAARDEGLASVQRTLLQITRALPRESLERFEALRTRCEQLREIALAMKHPGEEKAGRPLEDMQLAGLDRLLWIYLRLLYTQFAIKRFLNKTSAEAIRGDIERLQERIAALPPDAESPQSARIRHTLEDNLETSRVRLENWTKARDNHQLVELEIDRLENKIQSLSELAVNRQEPEFISSQVDHVAAGMMDTERTMNELRFVTGLDKLDEEPPQFLTTANRP